MHYYVLISLLYLTRSSPKLLHIYSLLVPADVRPCASYYKYCARAYIASHSQNGQYQNYHQMSTLYHLS